MRLPFTALVAAVALLAAGCGDGSSLSPDEFGAELDNACTELFDTIQGLPVTQQEEGLDSGEVEELGAAAGEDFYDTVEGLEAPDELADERDALVEGRDEAPPSPLEDPDAFREFTEERVALYEELGADGCAELQRETARRAEQSIPPPGG